METLPPPELIAYLESLGAGRIPHSGRTLLDHLVGTATVLARWGCSDATVVAGLFHSIYGTQYFTDAPLTFADREAVRARIGEPAERRAFVFCAVDRPALYAAYEAGPPYRLALRHGLDAVELSPDELRDLVAIVWANVVDQLPHMKRRPGVGNRRALERARNLLPPAAIDELTTRFAPHRRVGPPPSLARLFSGAEVAARFVAEAWPEHPFVAAGPPERLADLVTGDLGALLDVARAYVKAFGRTPDGKSTSLIPTPAQIRPLYDTGLTIYFHSIRAPWIDDWIDAIDAELGLATGMTRVSAFASRRGLGIPTHYDMNDNIVIQARGVKRWRIARNEHARYPRAGYVLGAEITRANRADAPHGFPVEMPADAEVVEMRPGMVMFVPRGYWHDCETVDGESLHFNIQTGLATWNDLVGFVLHDILARDVALREGVPHLFENGRMRPAIREELVRRLRAVVDGMTADGVDVSEAEFEPYIAKTRTA